MTLAITAMAKKMKAEGIDVIGFGAGEPDFNTPEYIIDAAKEALDKGFTKYTPSRGMPQLKEAICRTLLNDNNLKYSPSQIVVSNGAKHSLYNAHASHSRPGRRGDYPRAVLAYLSRISEAMRRRACDS